MCPVFVLVTKFSLDGLDFGWHLKLNYRRFGQIAPLVTHPKVEHATPTAQHHQFRLHALTLEGGWVQAAFEIATEMIEFIRECIEVSALQFETAFDVVQKDIGAIAKLADDVEFPG